MKLKSIHIRKFRRFEDLRIHNLLESARLIVLAGPNGCGKSSFFDALLAWRTIRVLQKRGAWFGFNWEQDYHGRVGSAPSGSNWQQDITVETFNSNISHPEKLVYARSAYRNVPEFAVSNLSRLGNPFEHLPARRMIDNDASTSRNYQQLVSQTVEGLFDPNDKTTTRYDYSQRIIGDVRAAFNCLFPDLQIDDLGNPLEDGTFRFTKGTSQGFSYKNLSGGEKAVFDLVLDLVLAKRSYDDTVYCIDEPEGHLNTRLQAQLLSALYSLVPDACQLILATHSIGIMRQARDIEREHPGTVAFLDFGDRDYDQPQIIEPATPDRIFWERVYNVALDDLATLVAPETVVICEGRQTFDGAYRNHSHDTRCYETIFATSHPTTKFIPSGNNADVIKDRWGLVPTLSRLFSGAVKVVSLIDRDDRDDNKTKELREKGVRVLSRRNLESYLLDEEVLRALADSEGKADRIDALLDEKRKIVCEQTQRDGVEDLKKASGRIYNICKDMLALEDAPKDNRAFLRDMLAPLVVPGMKVYDQLHADIFDP